MLKPFLPIPLKTIEEEFVQLDYSLILLLTETNRSLARFDGSVQALPNPLLFLSNLTKSEAVDSSRIEGTQATLDELYSHDSGEEFKGEKDKDLEEIKNYEAALSFGSESMQDRDLSLSLIKEMHSRLMQGVRGANKTPGCFRVTQNWIGRAGSTMENAEYVPPEPFHVEPMLEEMLEFYQESQQDILIKAAMVHAQFEGIHPFLDGNGRLGRLLIPLMLYRHDVLAQPVFYLSSYLEEHRAEYYQALNATHHQEWTGWLAFFLQAVNTQAKHNIAKIDKMRRLYARYVEEFAKYITASAARELVEALFVHPIFTIKSLENTMNHRVKRDTLRNWVITLTKHALIDVLEEGQGRKPSRYRASEIMDLLRS